MAKDLRPDWRYYDLENPCDYQLISDDPVAFFAVHHDSLVIDEAQQYPDLFRVLRGVIDADRGQKGCFLLLDPRIYDSHQYSHRWKIGS